ncbi:hypothetical protein Peur_000244 [Populus x canadensis]
MSCKLSWELLSESRDCVLYCIPFLAFIMGTYIFLTLICKRFIQLNFSQFLGN